MWYSEEVNLDYLAFQEELQLIEAKLVEYDEVLKNNEIIKPPASAEKNTVHLGARVTVMVDDGQVDEFDIVVSNPPYISGKEFPELKDELKVYEPQNALTDFSDGLNYYRIISSKAKEFVKSKGKIFFEVGQGQVEDVKRILAENNFNEISIVKDYLKIDRVISGVKN